MTERGRLPVNKLRVEHTLRERILARAMQPGSRLSVRPDFAINDGTPLNTVQEALG